MTDIKKYNMLIVMLIISAGTAAGTCALVRYGGSASYISALVCTLCAAVVYPLLFNHGAMAAFGKADGAFKKTLSAVTVAVFAVYTAAFAAYLMHSINSLFFNKSPGWYILLFLIVPSAVGCYFGVKSVSRYAGITAVFTIALICVVLIMCVPEYNSDNLYPLLGNGIGRMAAGLVNISFFGGVLFYYMLLCHCSCKRREVRSNVLRIIIISGAVISGVCLCTNLLLPYPAAEVTSMPLYTLAASVRGNYLIERSESVVLLLWIFAAYVCIGGTTAVASVVSTRAFNLDNRNALTGVLAAVVFSGALIIDRYGAVDRLFDICNYLLGALSLVLPLAVNIWYYLVRRREQ